MGPVRRRAGDLGVHRGSWVVLYLAVFSAFRFDFDLLCFLAQVRDMYPYGSVYFRVWVFRQGITPNKTIL